MYYVPSCILNLSYTSCTDEDDVPSTLKLRPLLTGLGWPPLLPPLFSGRRAPPPTPLLVIMSNAVNSNNNNSYNIIRTVFIVYIELKSSSKSDLYKNILRTTRPRNEKPPTAKTTTTTVTAVRSLTRTRHEWSSRRQ